MEDTREAREAAATIDDMLRQELEARKKRLFRRKLPARRTLKAALMEMTKAELDDIRYNLNVTGASSLDKAALAARLVGEILAFSEKWLPTVLEEEYQCFRHLLAHKGITTEFRDDDLRLDYLRGLGLVACGVKDGKLAWYMPQEVQQAFCKMDSDAYRSAVALNTEVTRLATGILFYYGYLNFEQLFETVGALLEPEEREALSFYDFVGILLNASCWKQTIVALPQGVKYYTLISEDKLEGEQRRRSDLDFAPLRYDEAYEAGSDDYIAATPAYKELARFFMQEHGCDVIRAADIVGEIYILLQNGGTMPEAADYLSQLGLMRDDAKARAVLPLLIEYNNTTRLWLLKGHTPDALMAAAGGGKVVKFGAHKRKAGRNDPCPCGSGKKYKNCCEGKDEAY